MIAAWACVTFSGDQTLKKQKKRKEKKNLAQIRDQQT